MPLREPGAPNGADDAPQPLHQVLGYLNFSSGAADAQFLAALNELFAEAATETSEDQPVWRMVLSQLQQALDELASTSPVFADDQQALQVLSLTGDFCPAYREFHADLLAHQTDGELFNSFFCGRAMEAILSCGPAGEDRDDVLRRANRRLNDYIGYRPVATLHSQKIEPYEHEWVRPTPLYIAAAGVAVGRYQELVSECLSILRATDETLLREAYFDPERMDELAVDPRAYDFEHPANKRPNHHFGQWDSHLIDNQGFYRRFVIQQVTLDALLERVEAGGDYPRDELVTEAAAVLAGTILMSSGISGYGPDTHDSTVSLSSLLMKIAAYRDAFYEQLLERLDGTHGARLREEASKLRQPFAAARQDLNRRLSICRATQLQRVQLAKIYAAMGQPDAARDQVEHLQVPAARLACQIDCLLMQSHAGLQSGQFAAALEEIEAARRVLLRGIECGAIVDPWNVLGFDGNFSLFGALENSVRDHRVDELVDMVERMLELYAQLWSNAAANECREVAVQTSTCFDGFVNWWHQFAAHELDAVDTEDPRAVYDAAQNVAAALAAWHAQGEATGDIGFWSPHVENFDSCRAYWLVVNTLLARNDQVAALGMLMHWLSQADRIPLEHGETSFYQLSLQWLAGALSETDASTADAPTGWSRVRRFFDYLEANAGDYWQVPEFMTDGAADGREANAETDDQNQLAGEDDEEPEEELFSAAYENVVYRDSAEDGVEGSVFDFDTPGEDYLQQSMRPVVDRLEFHENLASLWKLIAVAWTSATKRQTTDDRPAETTSLFEETLQNAAEHLSQSSRQLNHLLESVSRYRLVHPSGDPESMVAYDRLRLLKVSLTDQIINAQVCVRESLQFLRVAVASDLADAAGSSPGEESTEEDRLAVELLRALLHGDVESARDAWQAVHESLAEQPILYVPLTRGGAAKTIVRVKARQTFMQNLLHWLPRMGLLQETYELIELARRMERRLPVGAGAITEFDELFEVGCREIVKALIVCASADPERGEQWVVDNLEDMMEPILRSWLAHSRTLRLSVLEQVMDEDGWRELVDFIKRFGRDLFTQRFLNLGNVRGILHQGVETWLRGLQEFNSDEAYQPLLDALEVDLELADAAEKLTLVLEAVVESYAEYRDYNSTTTQSDQGDQLYSLLDFLRLRISYDRVVWNLRPIVLAHRVLAEYGCQAAAAHWRQNLQQRIGNEAQRLVRRLQELQQTYAMRLPSVSERIHEKFLQPLLIDRACAMIHPAMSDPDPERRQRLFQEIREQAEAFLSRPSGAGLDLPAWLIAMEEEVVAVQQDQQISLDQLLSAYALPPRCLSIDEFQAEIESWSQEDV